MRTALALTALAGIGSVAGLAISNGDIAQLKRDYISSLTRRRLDKRQSVTTGVPDATILNFALALEVRRIASGLFCIELPLTLRCKQHLEDNFYSNALQKFKQDDFTKAGFGGLYPVLQQVARDESTHVEFLTSALSAAGATPVEACNYTFPYDGVAGFLALSQGVPYSYPRIFDLTHR